jgi:hypothetical protein
MAFPLLDSLAQCIPFCSNFINPPFVLILGNLLLSTTRAVGAKDSHATSVPLRHPRPPPSLYVAELTMVWCRTPAASLPNRLNNN